jgi:hypothetical protein
MTVSNKTLYKLEIESTKIFPLIISILYILNTTLSYFGYDLEILAITGGMSLLPLAKLYLDSFTYKLCIHHRVFIYYIFLHNLISSIDLYTEGILINDRNLFLLHIILFGIFLFLYILLKRRYDYFRKYGS